MCQLDKPFVHFLSSLSLGVHLHCKKETLNEQKYQNEPDFDIELQNKVQRAQNENSFLVSYLFIYETFHVSMRLGEAMMFKILTRSSWFCLAMTSWRRSSP